MNELDMKKTEWMEQHIKEGMTVVDIGACVGLFTELLCKKVGATGKVIAFEPRSDNFRSLSDKLVNSNNVILENAGISDTNEKTTLYIYSRSGSPGWNSFYADAPYIRGTDIKEFVNTFILDSYLEGIQIYNVDFIKLDVEGYDLRVLHSMQRTLDRNPKIILMMEVHPYANDLESILKFFSDNKFDLYDMYTLRKLTHKGQLNHEEVLAYRNVL